MRPSIVVPIIAFALLAVPAHADVIMDWNAKADHRRRKLVNSANSRNPMLHVAMFRRSMPSTSGIRRKA
jgi:hypothetical protein